MREISEVERFFDLFKDALTTIGWIGLVIGIVLLLLAIILKYAKKRDENIAAGERKQNPDENNKVKFIDVEVTKMSGKEKERNPISQSNDLFERKFHFSEAMEVAKSRAESRRFRRKQKRTVKNIEEETAALKKIKETVETEVEIQKQMTEGYKVVGEYDKLPPLEKKQVELDLKKQETEMMRQELEQKKTLIEMEKLEQPEPEKVKELSEEEKERKLMEEAERKIAQTYALKVAKLKGVVEISTARAEIEKEIKDNYPPNVAEKILDLIDKTVAEEEIL